MDKSNTELQSTKEAQTQQYTQNSPVEGKKSMKEMSKAERRELQEKQRAEKEARKAQGLPHPKKASLNQTKGDSKTATSSKPISEFSFANLFSHLKLSDEKKESINIHPSVEKFITDTSSDSRQDSNILTVKIINLIKTLVNDYKLPDQAILNRDLPAYLNTQLNHIKSVYPFTASVYNTINFITKYIVNLDPNASLNDAVPEIIQKLEIFQLEKIETASENIAIHLSKHVSDNDVILTYGNSSVVQKALEFALTNGNKFTVIIVENEQQSGKALLDLLTKKGIQCTYTALNGLNYILQDATRIWLNSEALLIDGSILSNCGTGQIALASHSQGVPTLFFGESYKVWDKVLFNSTQWNVLDKTTSDSDLTTVKLKYDVTPYTLVERIVTESGEVTADKLSLLL